MISRKYIFSLLKPRCLLTLLLLLTLYLFYPPSQIQAALPTCGLLAVSSSDNQVEITVPQGILLDSNAEYYLSHYGLLPEQTWSTGHDHFKQSLTISISKNPPDVTMTDPNHTISLTSDIEREILNLATIPDYGVVLGIEPKIVIFRSDPGPNPDDQICQFYIKAIVDQSLCGPISYIPDPGADGFYDVGETVIFTGSINGFINRPLYIEVFDGGSPRNIRNNPKACNTNTQSNGQYSADYQIGEGLPGLWTFDIYLEGSGCAKSGSILCSGGFNVGTVVPSESPFIVSSTKICDFIPADNPDHKKCEDCTNKENPGVFTPFGCIETNPQLFIEKILKIAIGIAGGIAFLMIIYGGFTCMTSAGNPERLNSCKEIITSAIAGLLLIIFSVVILKIIGVDILKIPGFGA